MNQTVRGRGLGLSSALRTCARKRSFAGGFIFLSVFPIRIRYLSTLSGTCALRVADHEEG